MELLHRCPAPPPTALPEGSTNNSVRFVYGRRKKYDPGEDFEALIEDLKITV